MSKNYKQGIFEPLNKEKYKGTKNAIFRSSWELKFMRFCDMNENVISWGSECLKIAYWSPVDKRQHNYFPDFMLQVKKADGTLKTKIIEIKPLRQTKPPVIKKNRNVKTMLAEAKTYTVNQAKWAAAKQYCDERGWEFVIVTEKDL